MNKGLLTVGAGVVGSGVGAFMAARAWVAQPAAGMALARRPRPTMATRTSTDLDEHLSEAARALAGLRQMLIKG